MPNKLRDVFSPLRDIQHAIDLVAGSQLLNLLNFRMNHVERAELNSNLRSFGERFYSP